MPPPPADEDAGPGAASGGVLAQVRAATRPVHDALDALLPLGLRDYEDYRRYLGALLALADWLARGYRPAWPAHLAAWNDARRLQCLRADCLALGVHATPVRTPPPATPARWLGGCYVIEGSALGARLLSRHAAALAEARPEAGAARSFLGHVTPMRGAGAASHACSTRCPRAMPPPPCPAPATASPSSIPDSPPKE